MSFALVLGGGGTVGVAWEVGVFAGQRDLGVVRSLEDRVGPSTPADILDDLTREDFDDG